MRIRILSSYNLDQPNSTTQSVIASAASLSDVADWNWAINSANARAKPEFEARQSFGGVLVGFGSQRYVFDLEFEPLGWDSANLKILLGQLCAPKVYLSQVPVSTGSTTAASDSYKLYLPALNSCLEVARSSEVSVEMDKQNAVKSIKCQFQTVKVITPTP